MPLWYKSAWISRPHFAGDPLLIKLHRNKPIVLPRKPEPLNLWNESCKKEEDRSPPERGAEKAAIGNKEFLQIQGIAEKRKSALNIYVFILFIIEQLNVLGCYFSNPQISLCLLFRLKMRL